MAKIKHLIWFNKAVPKTYSVETISNITPVESSDLKRGEPLLGKWPATATCEVVNGNPKNPAFADSLLNTDFQIIVSERLKNALEEMKVGDTEYLPVQMKENQKTFDTKYYILHVLNLPDCLDIEASGAKMGRIVKTKIDSLEKIVFTNEPSRLLFRPSNYNKITIVDFELASKLSEIGFSGLSWIALTDHPHFDYTKKDDDVHHEIETLNKKIGKAQTPVITTTKESSSKMKYKKVPEGEIAEWNKSFSKKSKIDGEVFIPIPGEDEWLEVYNENPETWSGFDPKRYYCLGNNGQSNYWLFDKLNGEVVYFSHEEGYNSKNFNKVSDSLKKFLASINQ